MPQAKTNGVVLDYDSHGDRKAPAVLLIMGLGMPAAAWPPDMIDRLCAEGLRVIAFDNRDAGHSTHFADASAIGIAQAAFLGLLRLPVPAAYRLEDMAGDAVGLLDALQVERAHLVGVSMGGMIAQLMCADRPQRATSLTSIMSNTGNPHPSVAWGQPQALRAIFSRRAPPDDIDAVVDRLEHIYSVIGSPRLNADREASRAHLRRIAQRGFDPAAARRQLLAIMASGDRRAALARIDVPTLVIHGANDPLVPVAAGKETAQRIAGARLAVIESMGHDLPAGAVPHIAAEIARHVHAAEAAAKAAGRRVQT